jgi:hypothetical protein
VALIFFGVSLWLLQTNRTNGSMRSIAQINAIIVTLIGILTLIEYLFAINLGNSLTDQIDGEITLDRNNGTKFKITFKELEV